MIKRYAPSSWGFDFYPDGRDGPRIRKRGFPTRLAAAAAFRKLQKADAPGRRLSDFVEDWFRLHGHTLKDARYRHSRTLQICQRLGDPCVDDFTSADWADYRVDRLRQVKPSTVNHEQRYLSAVLADAVRLGKLKTNPLAVVRQIRVADQELAYLSLEQCQQLLVECKASTNPSCYPVALLCLATGARWGEVEALHRSSILPGKVVYQAATTKSDRTRAVPVDQAILDEVLSCAEPGPGRLFLRCRDAFRSAYRRTGFQTPQQLTHVLRHTFASHFVMGGGDILTLQRILGHANITVTMRYAHLSPSHLAAAVDFNPLTQMRRGQDVVNM